MAREGTEGRDKFTAVGLVEPGAGGGKEVGDAERGEVSIGERDRLREQEKNRIIDNIDLTLAERAQLRLRLLATGVQTGVAGAGLATAITSFYAKLIDLCFQADGSDLLEGGEEWRQVAQISAATGFAFGFAIAQCDNPLRRTAASAITKVRRRLGYAAENSAAVGPRLEDETKVEEMFQVEIDAMTGGATQVSNSGNPQGAAGGHGYGHSSAPGTGEDLSNEAKDGIGPGSDHRSAPGTGGDDLTIEDLDGLATKQTWRAKMASSSSPTHGIG